MEQSKIIDTLETYQGAAVVPLWSSSKKLHIRWRRISYLCAGVVYDVLLGSPTGSITLVSYLRGIPTADVLHHPLLFLRDGERLH